MILHLKFRRIYKLSKEQIIVILLILINERGFYLINSNLVFIVSLIGLFTGILMSNKIISCSYTFKWIVLSYIAVCLISIIYSYFRYGQSLYDGIYGTHYIFIYLLYFYFVDLFGTKKNDDYIEPVKNVIITMGTIATLLLIFQSIIYPRIIIFSVLYSVRNESLRIMTYGGLILFSFTLVSVDLVKKFEFKRLISFVFMLYYFVFVSQIRGTILLSSLSLMSIYIYHCKKRKKDLAFLMIPLLIICGIFIGRKMDILNKVIISVLDEINNKSGTAGIRVREIEYYYDLFRNNILFGIGILGDRFPLRKIIYGTKYYWFFVEDIGSLAFIFQTGLIGALWLVMYMKKIISQIRYLSSKYHELVLLIIYRLCIIIGGISFYSEVNDKNALLYSMIFLAFIEQKQNVNDKAKQNNESYIVTVKKRLEYKENVSNA